MHALTHISYRWRGEESLETISVCSHHTPATGGEERRESHRANQVYALTTHQLQVEGERVIEPIKCMLSPHISYRWRGERVIETIKCMLSPPHQATGGRRERDIEPISVCAHHTPATGGEERET